MMTDSSVDSSALSIDGRDDLWPAIDAILAGSLPEEAHKQGLGPLEALRRNRAGESVPQALAMEARMAAVAMMSARPLLERVRHGCEGPLVLMKGPEIALRYPGSARAFIDVDLLVPDPERAHGQLREAGFVDATILEPFEQRHHFRPLRWPDLPLRVEIHDRPHWPPGLRPPATASIIDAAKPSLLGIDGLLAPHDAHHALLVAAHAWVHEPLCKLRDLVDVRALASPSERAVIERTARAWRITRLWRTTDHATEAVLGRDRMPFLVRPWARHLLERRERTVFENHLWKCFAGYWALPFGSAVAATARAIGEDILPAGEEGWSDKLSRMLAASKNANMPLSRHHHRIGDAATRGRNRKRRRRDAADPTDEPSL
jgi:hypothetical protein